MNNTPKWIPKRSDDVMKLFRTSRELGAELRFLAKKFSTDINLDLLDFYEFQQLTESSRKCFVLSEEIQISLRSQIKSSSASRKIQRSPYKVLLQKKAHLLSEDLQKRHFQLIFIINKMIKALLEMGFYSEVILEAALLLCALYNESVDNTLKKKSNSSGAKICSNTFPSLLLQPKKIDIGVILQIASKARSEQCCSALISSLLAASKLELMTNDNESETSSIEILRTLTSHLTSPCEKDVQPVIHSPVANEEIVKSDCQKPAMNACEELASKYYKTTAVKVILNQESSSDKSLIRDELLERVIFDEEQFISNILMKCITLCPSAFENHSSSPDLQKWINRGTRSLWTQIGSTLDHVVLWWSDAPLACRPALCTKYLRDWLLSLQIEDAPEPILSTLVGLGETLTTHVSSTIWDKQFRLALVASSLSADGVLCSSDNLISSTNLCGTTTGGLWCELLNTLVSLCNSCDQKGTIPNQLPIVEQIPVLHRLDHSVHTMRLWATAKAKSLCSEWNMMMFFKLVNGDIKNCLDHLIYLRVPELASADALEVLIQVCVSLRWKLVSEIKENILKLKNTSTECIEILSSTCRTYSLATLSLCFPSARIWQTEAPQEKPNEYVSYFLTQVYHPVLEATNDYEILSLTLKIACEAWLDHIYLKKIKFTRCGAFNLLKDFDGVSEWILNCPDVPTEYIEKLSKHEVLRMCEGVGRILLRKPDEVISILPSPKYKKKDDSDSEDKAKLPPEMFVPNQKRWLELRARTNRKSLNCFCICNMGGVDS